MTPYELKDGGFNGVITAIDHAKARIDAARLSDVGMVEMTLFVAEAEAVLKVAIGFLHGVMGELGKP